METIIGGVLFLTVLGLLLGLGLNYSVNKFKAEEEPAKLKELKALLPAANCGACGFEKCDQLAENIFEGNSGTCLAGTKDMNNKLAEIMGLPAPDFVKERAYVKCIGTACGTKFNYKYDGKGVCRASMLLSGGGPKACTNSCLGNGSCLKACVFGAIRMVDGISLIDNIKCTGCGRCVKVCPKNIIKMIPSDMPVTIACSSADGAKEVRENCDFGCIGCLKCEKACEQSAIYMEGELAVIDYEKCISCKACVKVCPRNCIAETNGCKA